jgi:ubiquinone/menaquinone biosynthesis C-methylase UbiE
MRFGTVALTTKNKKLYQKEMNRIADIVDCYNKVAVAYAVRFVDELEYKPMDRSLLRAFLDRNKRKGILADLGCGPGHTTNYLYQQGCTNIVGIDISTEMLKIARARFPHLYFKEANFLELDYPDGHFGAAIAFYAIVNLDYLQVKLAFKEVYRVLANEGELLCSFHAGDQLVCLSNFLEQPVDIEFSQFEVRKIREIVEETGFKVVDIIQRAPYSIEAQTERAYIWVRK